MSLRTNSRKPLLTSSLVSFRGIDSFRWKLYTEVFESLEVSVEQWKVSMNDNLGHLNKFLLNFNLRYCDSVEDGR